ncbi:MAG: fibronectin type III domain-containing protein, partial [bacterium]|nr:fibronectin type III domain-containing protein [bacterium]
VQAAERRLTVSWSAPRDDGGAAVSGYRVELWTGGPTISRVYSVDLPPTSRSTNFGDLEPGAEYTVQVSAVNQAGRGAAVRVTARTWGGKPVAKTDKASAAPAVRIFLGADRNGCAYPRLPCRWVGGTLDGFVPGRYRLECYWSSSRGSQGNRTASRTITVSGRSVDNLCWFNLPPGRYLTVVVDGVQSNTLRFAATAPPTPGHRRNELPPSMADVDAGRATASPARRLSLPAAPRNLKATAVDSSQDDDRIEDDLLITWDPPSDDGGAAITGYRMRLSRPAILFGPDQRSSPWSSSRRVSGPPFEFRGLSCAAYVARVAAENQVGIGPYSQAEVTTKGCPLTSPNVELAVAENAPLYDDPGIQIRWSPVAGAESYHLDWRYVETDIDDLRRLFDELESTVSTSDATRLYQKIDIALLGDEVSASRVGGDSRPNSDSSMPEVLCYVDGSTNPHTKSPTPYCEHRSEWIELDGKDPTFRIRSVQAEHSLQARVRAVTYGDDGAVLRGDWSPWKAVSTGWLDDVCQPVSILGTLKNGRAAIEVGEWTAAAVGVVTAILSSEANAASLAAARHVLTRAAREVVRLALKKSSLEKLMVAAISGLADGTAETTELSIVRLMFDCVGYGAGLTRADTVMLGEEAIREYQRMSPELSDINIESAVVNFGTLMSESTRSQGRS